MGRLIFEERDLSNATDEILKGVDRAVLAAAFKMRDKAREDFRKDHSNYKYGTDKYYNLSNGIMVGKLDNRKVKLHALGTYTKGGGDDSYKTRFFVGGTINRTTNRGNKGYIKSTNSIEDGLDMSILNNYINNVLNG